MAKEGCPMPKQKAVSTAPSIDSKPKNLELSYNAQVVQANKLIRSKQDRLTLIEARLIRLAIAQILKQDKELRTYKTTASQLSKLLHISKSRMSENLDAVIMNLADKHIYIDNGIGRDGQPNYQIFHWLDFIERKDGIITFKLSESLKPYLIGLSELFSHYEYESLLCLPTDYAIRLYEILKSYQSLDRTGYKLNNEYINKNEVAFKLEQIKNYMDCPQSYYPTKEFMRSIIVPSVKAISEKTELRLSYRTVRNGRTIEYIVFQYLKETEYNKMLDAEAKKKAEKSIKRLTKEKSL